jgi:hypothetical protein
VRLVIVLSIFSSDSFLGFTLSPWKLGGTGLFTEVGEDPYEQIPSPLSGLLFPC